MKKLYTLVVASLLLFNLKSKAQDTLLFSDFELTSFYSHLDSASLLPGNSTDTMWYSFDADNHADASTNANRPMGFFAIQPISPVDQYETVYGTTGAPDTNTVLGCNSWTNLGDSNPENNWLVTPSVVLGSHDTLFWKSASLQTPRYLDGYEVLLSTQTNDAADFTHSLFRAAEMTGSPATDPDTVFADFTFAPTGVSVFVHGQDGTYIDPAGTTAPVSHRCRLHPFSVALDAYAGQNVFIAFHHNTADDNMISFDDVMIRGTLDAGITENANNISLNVFPNPATENAQVNYTLSSETSVILSIYDVTGKLISSENKGSLSQGRHFANINTALLAKGFYSVSVQTNNGRSITKLIVQ